MPEANKIALAEKKRSHRKQRGARPTLHTPPWKRAQDLSLSSPFLPTLGLQEIDQAAGAGALQ
jgi:hypothetical protein